MKLFLVITLLIKLHYLGARELLSPPIMAKQPPVDDIYVYVGDGNEKQFYLECEAIGEPTPRYRWTKNGQSFNWTSFDERITQVMGRGTLSITYFTDDDMGQYQCFAENNLGVAMSNSVFIWKAELGKFNNAGIISLQGNEGEPFKLSCEPPHGSPKPKIFWVLVQEASGSLKSINNSRMTTDPEGSLWFSNLTMEDASDNFRYTCVAVLDDILEYEFGHRVILEVASSGLSLNLGREPILQYVTRKHESVLKGKNVEMFCIFGGTPLPQFVWFKNGERIQFSDRINERNFGKSLVIKSAEFDDEGLYTCEVNNGIGEPKSHCVHLKVAAVPYFVEEPEIINSAEDETVEFRCHASGVPTPSIGWTINSKPIGEAPLNPRRKVGTNSLIIENVRKEDTGNYGCNATNIFGYIYKDSYLNVMALEPNIMEPPQDFESVAGKNISMTCRAYGVPMPVVTWICNSKILTGSRFTILDNGNLYISNVQVEDTGLYVCKAENKFGNDFASANLIVLPS